MGHGVGTDKAKTWSVVLCCVLSSKLKLTDERLRVHGYENHHSLLQQASTGPVKETDCETSGCLWLSWRKGMGWAAEAMLKIEKQMFSGFGSSIFNCQQGVNLQGIVFGRRRDTQVPESQSPLVKTMAKTPERTCTKQPYRTCPVFCDHKVGTKLCVLPSRFCAMVMQPGLWKGACKGSWGASRHRGTRWGRTTSQCLPAAPECHAGQRAQWPDGPCTASCSWSEFYLEVWVKVELALRRVAAGMLFYVVTLLYLCVVVLLLGCIELQWFLSIVNLKIFSFCWCPFFLWHERKCCGWSNVCSSIKSFS